MSDFEPVVPHLADFSPVEPLDGFPPQPVTPPIIEVARLNGVTQHWQLSEANLVLQEESVLLDFIADNSITSGQYDRFIASENFNFTVDTGESGNKFRTVGCAATLDGVEIVNETTPIPTDSLPHRLVVFPNNGGDIEAIGNLLSVSGRSISAAVFDFKIKNSSGEIVTDIPLTNRGQGAFQVATTTPLGANLYTQEVIENPSAAGDQWTYLGDGRWQLIGDGSANPLQFLLTSEMPATGYVQFEIESISGGTMSCSVGFVPEARFNTSGIKTYYYSDISEPTAIQFKRGSGAINLVIKNIKHYGAEGVLVATMINYSEDVWEEV